MVNAGVSGDTSAGGLRRLEWSLQGNPRVLVVALGGNDGLRGLPPDELKKNLAAIIEAGQRAGLQVILAGMEAPPNNGPDYTARFRRVYPELAKTYDIPLIPFLLEGVAGDPALNQADGIHPNPEGARRVADTVWSALEPVLKSASGVDDCAARRQQDRPERQRAAHHPASRSPSTCPMASAWPSSGRRAAASRRCSA